MSYWSKLKCVCGGRGGGGGGGLGSFRIWYVLIISGDTAYINVIERLRVSWKDSLILCTPSEY